MNFEKLSKTIQEIRFEKLITSIEDNPLLMELLELSFQAGAEKALEQRKPCQTCEALARTVMLDQSSTDLPPQRTWVGLTPQERDEINEQVYGAVPHHVAFHHAIEAKLKEKNT